MFHDRLGMVFGRVVLVALAVFLGSVLGGVVESVGILPFGTDPFTAPGTAVGAVAVILVSAVLVVPVYLVQLVGLVVTYAEQRAQEGPVNVVRLVADSLTGPIGLHSTGESAKQVIGTRTTRVPMVGAVGPRSRGVCDRRGAHGRSSRAIRPDQTDVPSPGGDVRRCVHSAARPGRPGPGGS